CRGRRPLTKTIGRTSRNRAGVRAFIPILERPPAPQLVARLLRAEPVPAPATARAARSSRPAASRPTAAAQARETRPVLQASLEDSAANQVNLTWFSFY